MNTQSDAAWAARAWALTLARIRVAVAAEYVKRARELWT